MEDDQLKQHEELYGNNSTENVTDTKFSGFAQKVMVIHHNILYPDYCLGN